MSFLDDKFSQSAVLRKEFELLTEEEFASLLDLQRETIERWRGSNEGPRSCKLGKQVFYRKEDIKEWIRAQSVGYPKEWKNPNPAMSSKIFVPEKSPTDASGQMPKGNAT